MHKGYLATETFPWALSALLRNFPFWDQYRPKKSPKTPEAHFSQGRASEHSAKWIGKPRGDLKLLGKNKLGVAWKNTQIKSNSKVIFIFNLCIWMGFFCIYCQCTSCTQCLWRSEEGVGSSGNGVRTILSCHVDARNQRLGSCVEQALLTAEPSL